MAEPKVRFTRDDGSNYPAWNNKCLGDLFKKNNERNGNQFSEDRTISIASMSFNSNGNGADTDSLSVYKVLRVGDVAFEGHENKEFSHGRFVMNDIGDGIMSPRFSCMRPIVPMVSGFWKYYIHSEVVMRDILIRSTKKGTMMHELVFEDLFKQSIDVPCLEEQQKIADFLSSVDDVISTSEQEVANLETQKKAVMKKIFSQEVRFKRADGTDFPEWEERDLVELFPYIRNGFVGTITDFFTEKENGIRYLQGTNIHDGIISDNVEFYVTREFHQKHINNELKEDDIIMVQSGHVGDCAVVGKKYAGSNCHALIIMSNAGNCCSDFYVDYFHSPDGLREISIKATGNTVKHILASVMQSFRVPYPSLEEQRLIADFLSNFDEAIEMAKKELELWKELKKGLLQQMFV